MDKNPALVIAAFDPLNGAGISLDLHVFELLFVKSFGLLTAILPQDPSGVKAVHRLSGELLQQQLRPLLRGRLSGLKVSIAAEATQLLPYIVTKVEGPKVFDPIVWAGGMRVMKDEEARFLQQRVFPLFDLVTPNLDEARFFAGRELPAPELCEQLGKSWNCAVLLKGGHSQDKVDYLWDGKQLHEIEPPRIFPYEVHGTGCFLSSAITALMIKGWDLVEAVKRARLLLDRAYESSIVWGEGKRLIHFKVDL